MNDLEKAVSEEEARVQAAVAEGDDWLRLTWDLWVVRPATPSGKGVRLKLVETVAELLEVAYDGWPRETQEEKQAVLRAFLALPVAKTMPENLKAEAKEFIR